MCPECGHPGTEHNDPAMVAPAVYECERCGEVWTNPPAVKRGIVGFLDGLRDGSRRVYGAGFELGRGGLD